MAQLCISVFTLLSARPRLRIATMTLLTPGDVEQKWEVCRQQAWGRIDESRDRFCERALTIQKMV